MHYKKSLEQYHASSIVPCLWVCDHIFVVTEYGQIVIHLELIFQTYLQS